MIAIKRSISFGVEIKKKSETDNKKNQKSEGRVRCVIVWNGQRVRLSVNHNVNPDYWEKALQRCRAKTTHGKNRTPASVINRAIDDLENLVNGIFMSFEEKDCIPTKNDFMEEYTRLTTPDDKEESEPKESQSIFPIFDLYIDDNTKSGRWSESALKKNKTIRRHLYATSPNMTFEDLEESGMTAFINHLSSIKDKEGRTGLNNDTIKKDIGFIKAFVRWAQEKGHVGMNKFLLQKVRLKTVRKTVIFLTWDELMKVYNHDFGNLNYLSHVRDVFCFCCFTSLRYSDVRNLRRSNFNGTSFTFTTIKTNDTLTIELNKYSKAILAKYENIRFPDDKVLPVISNQKMNDYLKEVGKMCEINAPVSITSYKGNKRIEETHPKWELLSTHAGRRTFVTNALMLGIPPSIVMKWTGHSDYRAMKPYIEVVDDTAKKAMGVFDRVEEVGQKVGQKYDNE
ncbi:MAG: site-specific integrase [Bacteroides sp.]|nr:site-specific integrase [Bacteroides sp.]